MRPSNKEDLVLIGGDAAAGGYGPGTQFWDGRVIIIYGIWKKQETAKGSNFLKDVATGSFDGKEVWMCTYNLVWAYYTLKKGMSSRKGLPDLVKDIKQDCQKRTIFFHPLHVSGARMIALGFDGLS